MDTFFNVGCLNLRIDYEKKDIKKGALKILLVLLMVLYCEY